MTSQCKLGIEASNTTLENSLCCRYALKVLSRRVAANTRCCEFVPSKIETDTKESGPIHLIAGWSAL